jgi:ribosomal protein S17E
VNKYSEQTQTRLFEEVALQQAKFNEALQTFVATAKADMESSLVEQAQAHVKTLMHEELVEQKQATLDVMADFYEVKVNESKESATQLAQTLSKDLVQKISGYANTLAEDSQQHLKQAQEALLAEASERIRMQVEQEMRVSADIVRQDFNLALNADLPEIQQLLAAKVQELFIAELPNFEQLVVTKAKAEVSQILSGIRLAFSG